MPRLLDRMPFWDRPGDIYFRHEPIRVRANQIIVWVSLGPARTAEPNPAAVPFPVVLDTGHTHTFAIQERHLMDWAGLQPNALAPTGAVRDRDRGQRLL